MLKKFKSYGKELVKVLENKDALNEIISDEISKIEGYFTTFLRWKKHFMHKCPVLI